MIGRLFELNIVLQKRVVLFLKPIRFLTLPGSNDHGSVMFVSNRLV